MKDLCVLDDQPRHMPRILGERRLHAGMSTTACRLVRQHPSKRTRPPCRSSRWHLRRSCTGFAKLATVTASGTGQRQLLAKSHLQQVRGATDQSANRSSSASGQDEHQDVIASKGLAADEGPQRRIDVHLQSPPPVRGLLAALQCLPRLFTYLDALVADLPKQRRLQPGEERSKARLAEGVDHDLDGSRTTRAAALQHHLHLGGQP
eukprot:scaffold1376_cov257-Pinguiococcus_pyrenoidosus.AAC.14